MPGETLTLIVPTCSCCTKPQPLTPRDDLPGVLAACPASGQLYRAEGQGYVPATLPQLTLGRQAPSVQIELSRCTYA